MTDLEIETAMDAIGQALVDRGKDSEEIREYLRSEADRVAQDIEDDESDFNFTR